MLSAVLRHRKGGRLAAGIGAPAQVVRVIEMTDAHLHRTHLVTDEDAVAGRADGGRYVAVCGVVVLPASLTTADAGYCVSCVRWGGEGKHENEAEKKRQADGQLTGPINPDTIREPQPGKREK